MLFALILTNMLLLLGPQFEFGRMSLIWAKYGSSPIVLVRICSSEKILDGSKTNKEACISQPTITWGKGAPHSFRISICALKGSLFRMLPIKLKSYASKT